MKKIILGTIALSFSAFSAEITSLAGESVAIFAKNEKKQEKPLIYLAENFHEMSTLPGFSMGAPSGLVSSYGVMFAGLSGRKDKESKDGALAFGMGIGSSEKIGGSVSVGVGSIDTRDGGAFNRGNLNLSLGHNFREYGFGTSIGVNGIDLWHATSEDGKKEDPSFYAAGTKLLPNDYVPITVTLGFGNNSFADINIEEGKRKDSVYGFGALGFYLLPQLSFIVDYTSKVLTTGISVVPFPAYPITASFGLTNLTKQGPDDRVAAIGTVGAAYVF
ncbi:MAG: hypothetical protein ACRCUR_01350 [Cetobacterium sp.]|uniref:hypothetical protein n=1 Tax=Cetobacterium sp. TaxID=2071632 RepID=UPI003F3082E8